MLVFWLWQEIDFGVTYILSVQYSCAVVSVFWLWREIDLKMRTHFYKKTYWVTLLWSASRCVYFIKPNTLLLCIFLFSIFLLYRADSQVEVQIRILLKDKYRKLCQKCKQTAITLWVPEQCLLVFFILEKQLASQDMFLVRSKLSITAYLFLVLYRSTSLISLSFLKNIETFLCK